MEIPDHIDKLARMGCSSLSAFSESLNRLTPLSGQTVREIELGSGE